MLTSVRRLKAREKTILQEIARKHGYFSNGEGSMEMLENGDLRLYVDFDMGSVATIGEKQMGEEIKKNFRLINEIFLRGRKIWPIEY